MKEKKRKTIYGINEDDWELFIVMCGVGGAALVIAFIIVSLQYEAHRNPAELMLWMMAGTTAAFTTAITVS